MTIINFLVKIKDMKTHIRKTPKNPDPKDGRLYQAKWKCKCAFCLTSIEVGQDVYWYGAHLTGLTNAQYACPRCQERLIKGVKR